MQSKTTIPDAAHPALNAVVLLQIQVVAKKGGFGPLLENLKRKNMNSIIAAQSQDFVAALQLLERNNLPTEDIAEGCLLFISREGDSVVGTIGIEFYKEAALLRSLAVTEEKRSKGVGKELVQFLEDFARKKGVRELVLLTTTAAAFFEKNGYTIITRDNVPEELKKSSEFTSTCPASATVMKKNLA